MVGRTDGSPQSFFRKKAMKMMLNRFLPIILRKILRECHDESIEGMVFPLYGSCLFADVSGFTALSEQLATMGNEGSESLTLILNKFYDSIVTEILRWDGDIIKFAGDAVTVFFDEPRSRERSCQCAMSMQQLMSQFQEIKTRVGTFALKMKIGIAHGPCISSVLGDENSADFLFAGPIVDQAAEAEHHATSGDVVLFTGTEFVKVLTRDEKFQLREPEIVLIDDSIIERFIPEYLLKKLQSEGRSFINEHRRAVVLFISFEKSDMNSSYSDIGWLQDFYQFCLEVVREYDGYINKIDMGDKGAKIIIVYGAPIAHEDDTDRALMTGLVISKKAIERNITTKIGINYSSIFAGIVGSEQRCEYTVMGDGVNLSARLMAAASKNGILCHSMIKEKTRKTFAWKDLPPLKVKGKSEPQSVAMLLDETRGIQSINKAGTFTGREKEVQSIRTFAAKVLSNTPRVITITGQQGIGKSVLLLHALDDADSVQLYMGTAHDYTKNTHYFPWKQILRDMLIKTEIVEGNLTERIQAILIDHAPHLEPFGYVLNSMFGEEESTEKQLDDQTRKNVLWKIIRVIIESCALNNNIAIVIENEQWLDGLSRELFKDLLLSIERNSPLFVITSRNEIKFTIPVKHLLALHLEAFTLEQTTQFAMTRLQVREFPKKASEKLYQMSRGVPLVIEEVLLSFINTGYLERSEEYPDLLIVNDLALTKIPETLDGMVMSRFDHLNQEARRFLRLVSVFGEEMPLQLLKPVLEQTGYSGNTEKISSELQDFVTKNMELDVVQFVQPYFRTVIYESIDFATRRELHQTIGRICQQMLPDDYLYQNEILAYHYSKAENAEAAIPYLEKVTNKSVDNQAYSVAIEQKERLVRFKDIVGIQKTETQRIELLNLLILVGEIGKAGELLSNLDEKELKSQNLYGDACHIAARIAEEQGDFARAREKYEEAINFAADDFKILMAKVQIGNISAMLGDLKAAHDLFNLLLKEYKHYAETEEYGNALNNLGLTKLYLGNPDVTIFEKSLRHFRKVRDIFSEIKTFSNLGFVLSQEGKYKKSRQYFNLAYEKASQFGFNAVLSSYICNVGYMDLCMLDLDEAQKNYELALSYARKFNKNSMSYFAAQFNLAEAQMHLATYDDAYFSYATGIALSRKLGFPLDEPLTEYGMFLYNIGYVDKLKEVSDELKSLLSENSSLKSLVATDFFTAILTDEQESKVTLLQQVYQRAGEQLFLYSFYALYELFEVAYPGDAEKTGEYLKLLRKLRTKYISFPNITIDLCMFRVEGSDRLVRKLDSLFRKYHWPHMSWLRHVFIAEYYLQAGRLKAARRRAILASNEHRVILATMKDSKLKQAFMQKYTDSMLRKLLIDLKLDDLQE